MSTPGADNARLQKGVERVRDVLRQLDDLLYMVRQHDYSGRLPSLKNTTSRKNLTEEEEEEQQPQRLVEQLNKYVSSLAYLDQNRDLFDGVVVPEALVYRVSGCSVDGDAAKPTPRPDRDINTNPEAFTVSELQRAENAVKHMEKRVAYMEMLEAAVHKAVSASPGCNPLPSCRSHARSRNPELNADPGPDPNPESRRP